MKIGGKEEPWFTGPGWYWRATGKPYDHDKPYNYRGPFDSIPDLLLNVATGWVGDPNEKSYEIEQITQDDIEAANDD